MTEYIPMASKYVRCAKTLTALFIHVIFNNGWANDTVFYYDYFWDISL